MHWLTLLAIVGISDVSLFAQTSGNVAEAAVDPGQLSVGTGVWIGLGASVVPIAIGGYLTNQSGGAGEGTGVALILAGFLVGPSAGNLYAHDFNGALLSSGIRIGGLVIAGLAYQDRFQDSGEGQSQIGLALTVLGSYGLSFLTIRPSVRKYNRSHPQLTLRIEPLPTGGLTARMTLGG